MAQQSETRIPEPDASEGIACPYGPPAWQYECNACGHKFEMPAPKGPTEEKNRTCPGCGSKDIKRLDIVKSEACPPGG
ncbi:MAG: hypothetical protein JXA51_02150 [Dehalococcoidales bacterium]|nr:hypothetical protein [Dehalococcoidales bacterium]